MKTYNVITIFPEMINEIFKYGVLSKGIDTGLFRVNPINLRDYTEDKHKTVDDYQYGGGHGLVMKPKPIYKAIADLKSKKDTHIVFLDPRGEQFTQKTAERLYSYDDITFVCGRYEGIDDRVRELMADEMISIGDFVITGGELAAATIIDAVARLIPGVLGDENSPNEESFTTGLLEYPHFTRPAEFMGKKVPEVLITGNHEEIRRWRITESIKTTLQNRPDMILKKSFSKEEEQILWSLTREAQSKLDIYVALMHYPMRDKEGKVVTTSITNMDLHDISRSCRTFGVKNYFVVNPMPAQREIASRVVKHWIKGYGATYNENRKEAFEYTVITDSLASVIKSIEEKENRSPIIIATTARYQQKAISIEKLKEIADRPILLLFGTGWGFVDDILEFADYVLKPIHGVGDFNHLSVRSAVAIYLDRINRSFQEDIL
ncbi:MULTISPECIES: tRNA (guanosine(37)-N1)-methyltransferase TrmD [Calditerrivibrio]|jgi:tRNA (guanine37-N1)-methyltransferase|uniref:tRNA (guanine-N(1)-)-methyltransferase n=1 Tax=Calditerrivibrio nitroreducens TaxID=477976 RepID=A0A2J6WLY5_9BACT|nr:MAG: tRNA (guanosine(37)-N1)-methyltransferase TrmD [Calditerrivibrio nitroreducens]